MSKCGREEERQRLCVCVCHGQFSANFLPKSIKVNFLDHDHILIIEQKFGRRGYPLTKWFAKYKSSHILTCETDGSAWNRCLRLFLPLTFLFICGSLFRFWEEGYCWWQSTNKHNLARRNREGGGVGGWGASVYCCLQISHGLYKWQISPNENHLSINKRSCLSSSSDQRTPRVSGF